MNQKQAKSVRMLSLSYIKLRLSYHRHSLKFRFSQDNSYNNLKSHHHKPKNIKKKRKMRRKMFKNHQKMRKKINLLPNNGNNQKI